MILFEGIRDLALPCTSALAVPLVALLVAGRGRATVAVGLVAGSAVTVWSGAALGVGLDGTAGRLLAALLLIGAGSLTWRSDRPGVAGVSAALAAGPVAALWQPCVGPRLGVALTSAPTDPWGQLLPLALWTLGATLPVVILAAVRRLAVTGDGVRRPARWAAAGFVLVVALGLAVATDVWLDVVGALVRAST